MRQKPLLISFMIIAVAAVSYLFYAKMRQSATNSNLAINALAPMYDDLLSLTSSAFSNQETIPSKYTCDGEGVNPPLAWAGTVPPRSKSFVLIMEDPDVPASIRSDQMFDHWVIFNIPKNTSVLDEASTPPGVQGANSRGDASYTGPCPPDREHRYFFKLFMLDTMLDLQSGATKHDVLAAMENHVMATAELVGRYQRQP